MEILIIVLLIMLNGVFSMSEIALVSSRKSRLEAQAQNGDYKAQQALNLASSPNRFLSTVQIGITLIGILTGFFSGASMTVDLQTFIAQNDLLRPYSGAIAVSLAVIIITYLSLVIGELVPKRIGLSNPEGISKMMAAPMNLLSKLTSPFIWLLSASNDLIIKLLGIKPAASSVTEDEIKALIQEGASEGAIEDIEHEIVKNVFHLGDRRIGSLMTYRQDIIFLDSNADIATNRDKILTHRQTLYPLCRETIDNVEGIIYSKDLIHTNLDEQLARLSELKKEAIYIAENSKAYVVLELFKAKRIHNGIVVDEYGGIAGMVTINDIFDALVGDISQQTEEDYEIIEREDGSFLVDAQIPFEKFLDYFSIRYPDRKEYAGFNTLAGFAIHILSTLPQTGDTFSWNEHQFEIIDMDKTRIDKILFKKQQTSLDMIQAHIEG
jgi:putative hemolysin